MDLSTAIRKRIINLCIEKNMNINQLAIKSGINPATIRSIIKSRCNTRTTQTIYYLCIGFCLCLILFKIIYKESKLSFLFFYNKYFNL